MINFFIEFNFIAHITLRNGYNAPQIINFKNQYIVHSRTRNIQFTV